MLSVVPPHEPEARPKAYAEAVSRLASVRHALRLVDGGFAAGPLDDLDANIATAWPAASAAPQHWFDRQSERLVATAAAGIEPLLGEPNEGREPHREANRVLLDQIRCEPSHISGILLA